MKNLLIATALAATATPALAAGPVLKPLIDMRLRYENVDQEGIARKADSLTARARAGIELASGDFAFLAESEATLALNEDYNSTTNGKTLFPVVADPENIELNRIQLQYKGIEKTLVTLGRQRINLDDQRFVGAVGWRDNEQTFDAVRAQSTLGPVSLDLAYGWSDRTIFGIDSAIQAISGDNVFAGAGMKLGPVALKGFAYLVDQHEPGRYQFSSQTYGVRASGAVPLVNGVKLDLTASYARQWDWRRNPNDYAADYWLIDAVADISGVKLGAGYEVLGSDGGIAFQIPLATLHKFQGWADKFLTTPGNGVRDLYGSLGYGLKKVGPFDAVTLSAVYHRFDSDRLGLDYGDEVDLLAAVKLKRYTITAKYADYNAKVFATDTSKFWLSLEWAY